MNRLFGLVGALALLGPALYAQTATARLTGSVIDPAGAAVPDAAITVRGEDTGLSFAANTNEAGGFSVAGLPPGDYSIEIHSPSFRRQLVRRFKVDVAKDNVLPPVQLEIGPVTEVVEVTSAGAGQVQTTSAEIAATVTMQQIQYLPLTNRNPLALISLEAGVAFNGNTPTVINGTRTSFSNVTLDGINVQDNYIRGNGLDFIPNRPLLDAVSEFTITTQNGNPSLGAGSSQVNLVTPSGTNQYHGNVYWYNRNNKFSANQWFSNKTGTPKPFLNLNQFGGGLGGPLWRDKLLFYTNYEGYRQRSEALNNAVILTGTARQGIFTYRDLQDQVQRVNVLTAAGVRLDPQVEALLRQTPGPESINNVDAGDSDQSLLRNTAGYRFNVRNNLTRDNLLGKIDFVHTVNHLFQGTYLFTRERVDRPDVAHAFQSRPVVFGDDHTQLFSLAWRWTPSPAVTNELRGGGNMDRARFKGTEPLPDRIFSGFVFTNPVVAFQPQGRDTDTFNYMDNVTWQRGRHNLRFGAQFQRVYVAPFDSAGLLPSYGIGLSIANPIFLDFSQFPGGISGTDLARAEDLLASLGGIIGSAGQSFNVRDRESGFVPGQEYRRHFHLHNYSFYGQDSWRMHPNLSVNVGVRWEYTGRFDERDGLMLSPIFTSRGVRGTLLSDAMIDFAGQRVDRPLYKKDLNNFAPNIGIAWDPFGNGKTAVRAAYSINYVNDEMMAAGDNATFQNQGLVAALSRTDLVTTMSGTLPTFTAPQFQVPRFASDNFFLDPFSAIFALDPRLRTPYVQQWNVGIQREVAPNTVAEIRYVGNHGTKLLRGFDFNQVIIRENGFLDDFTRARNYAIASLNRSGVFDPSYNPAVAGSQPLTVFPQLLGGGFLNVGVVRDMIRTGQVGELAAIYYVNGLGGPVPFTLNPSTFVADLITNYSHSSYNALQLEVRRRTAGGLEFQANYSFSKVLTDSIGGNVVRFDPFLDFANRGIERSRAAFDITHVFNANFVLPLPLGRGHRWRYAPLDRVLSDWTIGSILGWQTGAPFSILSGRGTLNRTGRSGQNTAVTVMDKRQLDEIVKFRMTGDGPFIIAASAINPTDNSGVAGDGQQPFNGQVFFHPEPGHLGTLQRRMFNGPSVPFLDLKIDKRIPIDESRFLRIETTFTNLFNHPVFFAGSQAIGSAQFGRVGSVIVGARVMQFGLRYTF
jgi:hypothetical protein